MSNNTQNTKNPASVARNAKADQVANKARKVIKRLFLLFAVVIVIWIIFAIAFGSSPKSLQVVSWQVSPVNSSTSNIIVRVFNPNTSTSITPTCTVTLNSYNYSDTGVNVFTANHPLGPRQTQTYFFDVTVSNNGAYNVVRSTSSLSC